MSLQSFTKKWLGKRTDADGVFGFQCVDLIKQYAKEELKMKPGAWGNAIDYWTNKKHPLLKKYNRVATQSPRKGDIVILRGRGSNPYGHIGIAVDGNTMLEQNGATGDGDGKGGDEIRYRLIPKDRIAGVLRPKPTKKPTPKYHTVKRGQYLSLIARLYRTTLGKILSLNPKKKKNPNLIRPGEKIKVKK